MDPKITVDEQYKHSLRLVRKEIAKVKRILEAHSQNHKSSKSGDPRNLESLKWDGVRDLNVILEPLEKLTWRFGHLLKGGE